MALSVCVVSWMLERTRPEISPSCIWSAIMATAGPMAAIAVAAVIEAGMKRAWATSSPFLKIAPSLAPSFAAICPPLFSRDSVASLTRKRP